MIWYSNISQIISLHQYNYIQFISRLDTRRFKLFVSAGIWVLELQNITLLTDVLVAKLWSDIDYCMQVNGQLSPP